MSHSNQDIPEDILDGIFSQEDLKDFKESKNEENKGSNQRKQNTFVQTSLSWGGRVDCSGDN